MAGKWKKRDTPPKVTDRGTRKQEASVSHRVCKNCEGERTVNGKTCPACKGVGGVDVKSV